MMTSEPITMPGINHAVMFGSNAGERLSVVRGFEGLGIDAAKVLLPIYEANPKGIVRRDVIVALGYVGESAVIAIPLLFVDLEDRELGYVQSEIIVAIGRIGSAVPDIVIPKLMAIHRSRDSVRI
jgi:hypothetical protein